MLWMVAIAHKPRDRCILFQSWVFKLKSTMPMHLSYFHLYQEKRNLQRTLFLYSMEAASSVLRTANAQNHTHYMMHLQGKRIENGKRHHSIYELATDLTSYCYMIPETYASAWVYDDATIVLVVVAYWTLMCTQYLAAAIDCLEIMLTGYAVTCDALVPLQ